MASAQAAPPANTQPVRAINVPPTPLPFDIDAVIKFAPATFVQPANWPTVEHAARASERLGPGVVFERWRLATTMGPLTVSIVRAQLRNPYVRLAAGSRNDQVIGPGEALSAIADRHAAIAGINADYYDIGGNGEPTNMLLENGVVQHAPNGRAALLVASGNQISLGPIGWKMTITAANGSSISVEAVNDWSPGTQLMLFTQRFGLPGAANADAEIVLTPLGAGSYRVARAGPDQPTFLPLAPDELGVAARGNAATDLLALFHEGDTVSIAQEWTPALPALVEGVGGGPLLLRAGEPYEDPNAPAPEERDVRYPLTGAGLTDGGATLIFVTVDGRAPGRSIGLTRPMFANLFAALGAGDAMAFDSGGSTEMVIRRLGDTTASVANVPSDGRERSIADGLLIINAATPGSAARLVLRAQAQAILDGSHLDVVARALDANDQPVTLPEQVRFSVSPSKIAGIGQNGRIVALRPGIFRLRARSGEAQGELSLRVVSKVAKLTVARLERAYPYAADIPLIVNATMHNGEAIAVDPDKIRWSSTGDAGRVEKNAIFRTSGFPSRSLVIARAGGARVHAEILVGAHHKPLLGELHMGETAGSWRLMTAPKDLTAVFEFGKAPDGTDAAHLSYDFGTGAGTRAAMAETTLPVVGEPLVITLDVYGDGSGVWLRGAYRNADGIGDTVTFARRVDWNGWRTVAAPIPPRVRWPIVWTRIYVVAPPGEKQAGDIWIRNLGAWYAGPG